VLDTRLLVQIPARADRAKRWAAPAAIVPSPVALEACPSILELHSVLWTTTGAGEKLSRRGDTLYAGGRKMTEFINDWERRMSELEDMRLAGKFGKKDEYSICEIEAMIEELQLAGFNEDDSDLDAIEALFKKLNETDAAR
jgi:hypothetical protein